MSCCQLVVFNKKLPVGSCKTEIWSFYLGNGSLELEVGISSSELQFGIARLDLQVGVASWWLPVGRC